MPRNDEMLMNDDNSTDTIVRNTNFFASSLTIREQNKLCEIYRNANKKTES